MRSGAISYAITSGNLVCVSVFDQIGFYDKGFFVDCIDFCVRLRLAVMRYIACPQQLHRLPLCAQNPYPERIILSSIPRKSGGQGA